MRNISVCDITLRQCSVNADTALSFKEKLEIAKQLDKLNVTVIETASITDEKTDTLLLRSMAPIINNSILSIPVGLTVDEVQKAYDAVSSAKHPRLTVNLPVSSVQMEYICHKKPSQVIELINELVTKACSLCEDVEFSAEDATRSDKDFLYEAIKTAIKAGAKTINISDSAGAMLPSEFKGFIDELITAVPELSNVALSVECSNLLDMANASVFTCIAGGAAQIKTSVKGKECLSLEAVMSVLRARGDSLDVSCKIDTMALRTAIKQIHQLLDTKKKDTSPFDNELKSDNAVTLDGSANITQVGEAVKKLGYDLTEDDKANVFEAFCRVVKKKDQVSAKELDAIVASTALQVPPTYKLISYVINSGNIITSTAHVVLEKNGQTLQGISVGDGPIDAALLAVEKIIGHHYELDDFQIEAVTEGTEAMGDALVKIRSDGKLFSGKGISTDIIGASVRAYINAINKIVYEENI